MDNPWATVWDERRDPSPPSPAHWDTPWPTDQCEGPPQKQNQAVSLLVHCQKVSQEIWPPPETDSKDDWRSGFDDHPDIIALLAQLLPTDFTVPPAVQFSATATAKAMDDALKLTRHLPTAASSPLSRLIASKGSLDWEKSIKASKDIAPDTTHVGWRVLEKEDRLATPNEPKPRKVTGGLLSFWNRRASTTQTAPVETPRERSSSPARSSQETFHSPSSQAASPPNPAPPPPPPPPPPSVPPPAPTDSPLTVGSTAPASSAVSRFLNRFSRLRGAQHSALALSSDDLEFLSDIVPSASDEDIDASTFDALTGASNSSALPPKLPPLIPPPPKQPTLSSHPSSVLGLGTSDLQAHTANQVANVPVLAPPLSPKPAASLSRAQSPSLDVVTPTATSSASSQPSPQSSSLPLSSFTLLPPQKTPPLLSIPRLLPPPPVSPPQTPRPSAFSSKSPGDSSTTLSTNTSSFHDSYYSDNEFSAFASFPPPAPAPFPSSSRLYPSQGSSPPSPPPRRSYEPTHYPNSSSASSILSPASQSSLDRLCSTRSSISASLDSFDDFVSPPLVARGEDRKRTPSPPPLPVKPQLQHRRLLRLDTSSSRVYHAHTSSQTTFTSPTVHTSLMHGALSSPSVSDAEHRRTQGLVDHAAARGGTLWPNSPDVAEPKVKTIPPPPRSTSTSPKSLIGQDLLGDSGSSEVLPAPLSVVGSGSKPPPPPATGASRAPFGSANGPAKGVGFGNQWQPSLSPMSSASVPTFSLSPLSTSAATGTFQSTRPRQTGGLSAQDLSFFEGL